MMADPKDRSAFFKNQGKDVNVSSGYTITIPTKDILHCPPPHCYLQTLPTSALYMPFGSLLELEYSNEKHS